MKRLLLLALCFGFTAPVVAAEKPKRDPKSTFKKMDKNSDSKVTKEEFSAVVKDAAKAEKTFAKLDKNGDGSLSLEELSVLKGAKK
jgi:Ca2+-binding EF-hand superfamily protein